MASSSLDAPFNFTAGMPMPGGEVGAARNNGACEDLVRQTRREIADIVREVATLARKSIEKKAFFAALLDNTTRALAAEGAVIWELAGAEPRPILRTGRVTDRQILGQGRRVHSAMLHEIAAAGNPVVVPPTPVGEHETDNEATCLPANPTDRPAAVVPILDPLLTDTADTGQHTTQAVTGSRYVLEVFLEPEAGVATQRGYLRFTAQMADLAGDFLRLDEIRRSRVATAAQNRLGAVLPRLYRHDRSAARSAEIVDVAAELLSAARATLVRMSRQGNRKRVQRSQILAISHVESIDRRGAACRALRDQIASLPWEPGRRVWLGMGNVHQGQTDESENDVTEELASDASLVPLIAISLGDADEYRLLIQAERTGQQEARRLDEHELAMMETFAIHAAESLRAAATVESIPLARVWLTLVGSSVEAGQPLQQRGLWKLLFAAVLITVLGAVAFIPTTMNVSIAANLRPENVRMHYAPSDAVVQEVLVRHGEQVAAGQALLVLQDLALDEQTTTLIGRRAVVSEKLARVVGALVGLPSGSSLSRQGNRDNPQTSDDSLVQQQRLLEEEQRGIDQQLELLSEARQRLVIRADRTGVVDAWQTELVALGRPVRTGELLIRIQPENTRWAVDARVPQNRRQIVMQQLDNRDRSVRLRIGDDQGHETTAHFTRQIGFEPSAMGTPPTALVELVIDSDDATAGGGVTSTDSSNWRNGMPAEVMIDCGQMPLAKVLFFDLIRSIRLQWAKWL